MLQTFDAKRIKGELANKPADWRHCSRAWQVGYIQGLMQALGL